MGEKSVSYSNLSSKIRDIYIALPCFNFFHEPSSVKKENPHFVGRERISKTLKNYLKCGNKEDSYSGSYLITGYRGMGKSSFVGKVIKELIDEQCWSHYFNKTISIILLIIRHIIVLSPFLIVFIYEFFNNVIFLIFISILCAIFIFIYWICKHEKMKGVLKNKYIHSINVNLGNEVFNEKDVLALIANQIREKFKRYWEINYKRSIQSAFLALFTNISIVFFANKFYNASIAFLDQHGVDYISAIESNGWFGKLLSHFDIFLTDNFEYYRPICVIIFSFSSSVFVVWCIKRVIFIVAKHVGHPFIFGKDVIKRLNKLCERIDSSIDKEINPQGAFGTKILGISISKRETNKYTKASTREIEQELIEIISDIIKSPKLNSRFIIVLDELDKINPDIGEQTHIENTMPEFSYNESEVLDTNLTKTKKQSVLCLLSQLKYFISTAQAKFVFIAGHELYDAALADVSDREFSLSSMFNGIINIESFFSDGDSQSKDVTKMTEEYVCKQLMGNKDVGSLSKYYEEISKEKSQKLRAEEKERVIVFLKHFITYLTFLSNGAPKKITNLFEKYIISEEEIDKLGGFLKIEFGKKNKYFLRFNVEDQQRIGFIHYIAYPIFQNIISPASDYGDKLLISSSFMLAHIYKYHANGFSWQNLEYLPELIESNRTPELREFIYLLLGYMKQTHLTTITSGLYHYKFPMRLIEEISAFTKKSEEIAALFNFSQDESKAVKQYYQSLLEYHKQKGNISVMVEANLHDILGDLHLVNEEYTEAILQFRVASVKVKDVILKTGISSQEVSTLIVQYIKSSLKLGIAQEKRNTTDLAYTLYNDLIYTLIAHKEIDRTDFTVKYLTVTDNEKDSLKISNVWKRERAILCKGWANKGVIQQTPDSHIYGEDLIDNLSERLTPSGYALISKLSLYQDLRFAYLPILVKLFVVEKQHAGGITKDNIKMAEREFKSLYLVANTEDKYLLCVDFFRKMGNIFYYKNSNVGDNQNTLGVLFDIWGHDLKIDLYNHLGSKYSQKENNSIIGILTNLDIEKLINSGDITTNTVILNLYRQIDEMDCLPHIKFKCKNIISEKIKSIANNENERILDKAIACCKKRCKTKYNVRSCLSCKYYNISLRILMNKFKSNDCREEYKTKALFFLDKILMGGETKIEWMQNDLNQIALTLDATGDTMLSCSDDSDEITYNFLAALINERNEILIDELNNCHSLSTLEKSILYYRTAAEYFYETSNINDGTRCMIKILNVLSAYIDSPQFDWKQNSSSDFFFIKKGLNAHIRNIHSSRDFSSITEIKSYRKIFANNDDAIVSLGLLSITPDIEELLFAYYEFVLKFDRGKNVFNEDLLKLLYHSNLLTNLRNDGLINNRIISLYFKTILNTTLLQELLGKQLFTDHYENKTDITTEILEEIYTNTQRIDKIDKILKEGSSTQTQGDEKVKDILIFLISDSIFCLSTICEALTLTSKTTLFTNNFCGGVYKSRWDWTCFYVAISKIESDIKINIDDLLGKYRNISLTYYRECADRFFRRSKEMHTGGQAYQDFIDGFYMLEDDLQNNTCQFYLALERFKINNGSIKKYRERLERQKISFNNSSLYEPENYFKEHC